jgi:acetyl esterase/lipase
VNLLWSAILQAWYASPAAVSSRLHRSSGWARAAGRPGGQAASPGWIEDAGIAYTAPKCVINGGGSNLLGDVYRPASPPDGPLPAVVLIHGGASGAGAATIQPSAPMSQELATLGYVVYNIDYCLANITLSPPARGYPMQITDVEDAIKALTRSGFDQGRVNVNPAKVATWGSSAGATLSAVTGAALGDTGATPVAAMVSWSGGYDFLDFRGGNPQNEQGPCTSSAATRRPTSRPPARTAASRRPQR